MNHILLIGAGFSRNWGGWLATEAFEYLLSCPEISNSTHLRQLLWQHQRTGGFESALAEVQRQFRLNPQENTQHLQDLQGAIAQMFVDMNQAFFQTPFEFQQDIARMIRTFLVRFDAIFSLNQDLLLEHHYLNDNIMLSAPARWNGPQLPGMQLFPNPAYAAPANWAQFNWAPKPQAEFTVADRLQPFFKLHGSSNWQGHAQDPLLIMGADKVRDIQFHPILSWYYSQFENFLSQPDTRLMVIGYGFRDVHINEVIVRAVEQHNLQLFVIDPAGADLARTLNPTYGAQIQGNPTPLEEAFRRGLIGASRRTLREIFGTDSAEHHKVRRFFAA
jgi:hypothetical protein